MLVFASSAEAVKKPRIPNCAERPVPALCTVHLNHRLANYFQALMHKPPWPYHYGAERHVTSRAYFVWLWTRHRIVSKQRYAAWRAQPWLHGSWLAAALCVKSHEGAWTSETGNGYHGGFQMNDSFERTYGAEYYARWGHASRWPSEAQLHAAYRGWLARGWYPWPNTAAMCGLL